MSTRTTARGPEAAGRSRLITVAWTAAFIEAFYTVLYPIHGFRVPIGSDTPVYVWWARYAGGSGLGGLGTRGRPAIVGLLASLARVTGPSAAAVAEAAGPVLAAVLALAVGALVQSALGEHRPRFALVVVLTGSYLSLMVAGYLSTLCFGAAFVAALAVLARDGLDRTGWRPVAVAACLVAAAGLAHLLFLALAAVVVAGSLIALVPATRRDLRAGTTLPETPAGRVAAAAAGGAAVAAAGFVAVGGGPAAPETSRDAILRNVGLNRLLAASYRRKLVHDFPWFRTLTVLGLAETAAPRSSGQGMRASWMSSDDRPKLLFWGAMAAWLVITAGAILVLVAGPAAPGQRLAAFCLPLPILAGIGLARIGRARRTAALGGAVLFLLVAWLAWGRQQPLVTPLAVTEARQAATEFARQPPGTPLILVVDDRSDKPGLFLTRYANFLRDEAPPARVPDVHAFLGTPQDLLAGRPTLTGAAEHDLLATSSWREVAPLLAGKPLAVVVRAFDGRSFSEALRIRGSVRVASGVLTLPGFLGTECPSGCGVSAQPTLTEVGAGPLSPWLPVWLSPALLILLAVIGFPWVRLAVRAGDPTFDLALAPAFGVAAVGLASIVFDVIGLRLGGAGGWAAVGTAVLGWPVLWRSARRARASG